MEQVKACIFDLDGTLLDTLKDLTVLTNTTLDRMGYPTHTSEEICSYIGGGARPLIEQAVPSGTNKTDVDRALALWKKLYPECGYTYTKPFDGIVEVLDMLHEQQIKIGILSNKFNQAARYAVHRYLPGKADFVHGEGKGFPRKPDPIGLLASIAALGVLPQQTVYVGDSPTDIEVAQRAGTHSVGVSWGYHPGSDLVEAHADRVIDAPKEFLTKGLCF
jgi:phosphoglycolate phosphatase